MLIWRKVPVFFAFAFAGFTVTKAQTEDEFHSSESITKSSLMESEVIAETTESEASAQWDCTTGDGASGICKELHECYPIFSRGTFQEDALYEETASNLKSELCSESTPRVCCGVNETNTSPGNLGLYSSGYVEDDSIVVEQSVEGSFQSEVPIVRASFWSNETCGDSLRNDFARNKFDSSNETKETKITGGKFAKKGQFPWMVAIFGKNKKHSCGGSLLNKEYVLTAAHCMFSYKAQDLEHLSVHIGDHNIRSLSDGQHETRKIAKIILHKEFNIQNYHNDVALLKLDAPVSYSQGIQPICLPSPDLDLGTLEGKEVSAMGWGLDRPWGRPSDILKYVEMPVWKFSECKRIYNRFAPNRLETWNLCAGDGKRNKDACIGDSGGPLVQLIGWKWTQLGIVSWGKGCGSFPGVYTSTQSFLQWIDKHVKDA